MSPSVSCRRRSESITWSTRLRHDPEARLVQHEEARPRHERAGDGQHLRLAAAQRPCPLPRPLAQDGKQRFDPLQHLAPVAGIAVAVAPQREVLGDAQAAEQAAALGHQRHAELDPVGGVHRADGLAGERHLAGLRRHQTGDGLEQRGLARAVGADERHDLAGLHPQRHALQRPHAGAVGHVHVARPPAGYRAARRSPRYARITCSSRTTARGARRPRS